MLSFTTYSPIVLRLEPQRVPARINNHERHVETQAADGLITHTIFATDPDESCPQLGAANP
eukprot:619949-Amphidinium_carterae.1